MQNALVVSSVLFVSLSLTACGGSGAPAAPSAPTQASSGPTDPSLPKGPDHPESDKVTWKKDVPAKGCHTGAKPSGDLAAAVTALASGCVDTKKMHPAGPPTKGDGQEGGANMVTTVPFKAQANHCYRFVGLAEPAVTDLDVAVLDSAGKSVGEDLNDSNDAVLLEDSVICFKQDDTVNVNVAVAKGQGKWAVQTWSD